ncbi:glycerophosphoryl diester phosphodiesterase [Psychrobacillus sp. OK028]|uniref:glycerophosphodiester phosphodiesterase family protein n=1 Tax=Psychrobacillus sp. OK028 TaxID=1884359 RepID=UPI00088AE74F|nr:glycerophosphodiester phosphodiesterase family protein [Psychrobacillus sp. OK028]SDO20649.1 glycerophosphoryl diester phosphodiesterase [Psychrobacillus sp. OK028]
MRLIFSFLVVLSLISGCASQDSIQPIETQEILFIAHRGASAFAPEHTMTAYEIAHQANVDYIEIDLQMTKDGVLVAMHDEKLDRTTDGTGFVKEYTLKELKNLNAGKWFNEANPGLANREFEQEKVPTLEEIFLHFGDDVNYYIELKSPRIYEGMEEKVVALIKKYDLIQEDNNLPKVILESFNEDSLTKLHALEPSLPLIQLLSFKEKATLSNLDFERLRGYASGIGMHIKSADQDFIHEAQLNGLQVHLFSIKNEIDMKNAIQLDANGIFIDNPTLSELILKDGG